MTTTGQITPAAPLADAVVPCDTCGAPLDARQRYCVECGTHRPDGEDPVARYLAEARRARNAPPTPPAAPARVVGGGRLALAIALVPLAAAVGVMVGRGDGTGQQVLDALKVQKAPVVNVVGGTGGAAASDTASTEKTTTTKAAKTSGGGKVLARTSYGTARQLEGSKPTASQIQESKQALKTIQNSKGKAYVESQRNLPDQIVVP